MPLEEAAVGAAAALPVPDDVGLFGSAIARRTISPGFKQAAKSKDIAVVGKSSPLEAAGPFDVFGPAAAPHAAEVPVHAVRQRPKGAADAALRPTTGMSLRERAYLKSSMGNRGEPMEANGARPPLRKVKPIPKLDLRVAVMMGDKNATQDKPNRNDVLKFGPGQKALRLPPRPVSVLEGAQFAGRLDALRVDRPHSVASTVQSAGSPVRISFMDQVETHAAHVPRFQTAATSSRASTALEPLRLNTAELIRQNEILRLENEELRQAMLADDGEWHGAAEWQGHAKFRGGTAASRRSSTLTALSKSSTISSSGTNRSGLQKPADDALTVRSNLSTTSSIRYFQGAEAPAQDRIEALKAEISHHQQQEAQLRAALFQAANTLPTHAQGHADRQQFAKASGPNSRIQSRASTRASQSPAVRSSLALPSLQAEVNEDDRGGVFGPGPTRTGRTPSVRSFRTQLSETPSIRSSLPRTVGNLTPYPRETTAASNAAVIGQQLTTIGEEKHEANAISAHSHPVPLTTAGGVTAGPHAISIHSGENKWVANGLKIDPRTSTVAMSLSARLTYPNKRLQTVAIGGGGSYGHAALGRGSIMVEHAVPLSDGLMVRGPNDSTSDGTAKQAGATAGSGIGKTKLKGDANANCWHASNVTSALRWEARTRKFLALAARRELAMPARCD